VRSRHVGRIVACTSIGMACMLPPSASAQAGRTEIASVRFEGNQSFPGDSLARAIVTRETECPSALLSPLCVLGLAVQRFYLSEAQVPRDSYRLERFYVLRGFPDAAVEPPVIDTVEGRANVSFAVVEGQPITVSSIDVLGIEGLAVEGLLDDLPLAVGERMGPIALAATRETLTRRLQDEGYAYAEVLRRSFIPADAHEAAVTFEVDPGPLSEYGEVTVAGTDNLSASTIRRTAQLQTGRLFRRNQLIESQARLYGLDIVSSASVEPLDVPIFEWGLPSGPFSARDSVIPITLQVNEGDAYRFLYGGGWGTAECFNGDMRWTARNFKGSGRVLQLRGRLANILASDFHDILCPLSGGGEFAELNYVAAVDFAQPWIFSTRNSFLASLFGERQSLKDAFVRRAVGLDLALTRAIGPQTPLTISYRPELSSLEAADPLFCTGFLVCTRDDIDILASSNWIAPIGISFSRDLSNNPLNPTRGYRLVIDVEHAAGWTGSNFRYDRVVGEGRWSARQGLGAVFAARLRGGWVGAGPFSRLAGAGEGRDIVHPQKRFYAGGANSVRGFDTGRLGPRILTVDPIRLLNRAENSAPCTPEQVIDLTCDASGLADGGFISRPTGGTRVIEAGLELRFRLSASLEAATFLDVGQVWGANEPVDLRDLEFSPGTGIRFASPIGPLRIDVGYRFRSGEALSVVTSQLRPFAEGDDPDLQLIVDKSPIPFVRLNEIAVLGPSVLFGESSALSWRRLRLHFSIGQAF
jgi:translocation and assembly module TamA